MFCFRDDHNLLSPGFPLGSKIANFRPSTQPQLDVALHKISRLVVTVQTDSNISRGKGERAELEERRRTSSNNKRTAWTERERRKREGCTHKH